MKGLSSQEYQALILSVGTHRRSRSLSPLEVANLLGKAIAKGATRKDCSAALGVGSTQIATFLSLLDLAPELQHLADWRGNKNATIPFSTLAELGRLSESDQNEAAREILRHGLTWKEAVQAVQMADRSGKTIIECIADVLNLRTQVETRHLFVGAIICSEVRTNLEQLSQHQRDVLFVQALKQVIGPNYPFSGRLGTKEFAILTDHDVSRLLDLQPDELEQEVNRMIRAARTSP